MVVGGGKCVSFNVLVQILEFSHQPVKIKNISKAGRNICYEGVKERLKDLRFTRT